MDGSGCSACHRRTILTVLRSKDGDRQTEQWEDGRDKGVGMDPGHTSISANGTPYSSKIAHNKVFHNEVFNVGEVQF